MRNIPIPKRSGCTRSAKSNETNPLRPDRNCFSRKGGKPYQASLFVSPPLKKGVLDNVESINDTDHEDMGQWYD